MNYVKRKFRREEGAEERLQRSRSGPDSLHQTTIPLLYEAGVERASIENVGIAASASLGSRSRPESHQPLLHQRRPTAYNRESLDDMGGPEFTSDTDHDAENIGSPTANGGNGQDPIDALEIEEMRVPWWSRSRFTGAILFNAATFMLPAIYGTLAKLWIAKIDTSMVATTDVYTYIGIFAEVLNEGLPRVAYLIIGDKSSRAVTSRIKLSNTLIIFQTLLGLIMSIILCSCASRFADTWVPEPTRKASLTYVRIASFSALASAVEVAVAAATRALDKPEVPLGISAVKVAVNIALDGIFLSTWRSKTVKPTVNTQAWTRLACDLTAACCGLVFYLIKSKRLLNAEKSEGRYQIGDSRPSLKALWVLASPGLYTFVESAFRNVVYLWLISGVVAMGLTYATAWGVFNTIRWGVIMVPVQAFEATASTFIGHRWGAWRSRAGIPSDEATGKHPKQAKATHAELRFITRPAFISTASILAIEIPLFLIFTFAAIRPFAMYLSGSSDVSDVVQKMWKTIDWCYIFYAVSTQLSSILIATKPEMYWWKSFTTNVTWDLPWAAALTGIAITEKTAWRYHAVIFGGSLVWSTVVTVGVVGMWWWTLVKGRSTRWLLVPGTG